MGSLKQTKWSQVMGANNVKIKYFELKRVSIIGDENLELPSIYIDYLPFNGERETRITFRFSESLASEDCDEIVEIKGVTEIKAFRQMLHKAVVCLDGLIDR